MPAIAFVVPGSIHALTGGSIYDRRIVEQLCARGWTVDVRELASPADAAGTFAGLPNGRATVVDGMIYGAIPDIVERHASRLRFVALVHLPLALEPGLSAADAAACARAERRSLAAAKRVVVTGPAAAEILSGYGVDSARAAVVEPGTDSAPLASGSGGSTIQLLCVACINAGKGHEVLVQALASLRSRRWHLTCVGSTARYPDIVGRLRGAINAAGLEQDVTLAGELSGAALAAAYDKADAFVLATHRETYGMAVAEALARGLPIVSTRTGAIPDLAGDGAGLLVPTGDVESLADALEQVIEDDTCRAVLRAGAVRARARLQAWDIAGARMAAVLEPLTKEDA